MSNENADQSGSIANVVGIGADSVGSQQRRARYPVEWKECCRDIYAAYQEHLSEQFGSHVGWQRIRNLVMREFDTYEAGRLADEDSRLRRQDIEHWMKDDGSDLSEDKFRFLDHYLHKELLRRDSDFTEATRRVIAYREALQYRALKTLYLGDRREVPDDVQALAHKFVGQLFIIDEPPSEEENFRTALYIKSVADEGYFVIGFYFKFTPESAAEIIEYGYRYHGYLLPMSMADELQGSNVVCGLLTLFDRSLLGTKEAIYHNAAHCFMVEGDRSLKIAAIESVASPFRPVTQQSQDKNAIRETMALTIPQLYPSYAMQSQYLYKEDISKEQKKLLESLHDEYLVW
ncbi:hypothetical protein BN1012_Phect1817 [Candidatus Phaeomarinobacter ectocarpi]|uniref:Uncharacterized protein n=1 Tax=Candidatus Phaeomarinibacter ectocarpi TaxID=1458461 RepID=X5MND9_9HYPH|nr:hypothetical protein [Candidatus Phaeomarinobacter ectocarpi]CDO60031.1 hypothetical protein BN1012_Phect1817 [Candidatus Phaeomarinobacter ectocarpi]